MGGGIGSSGEAPTTWMLRSAGRNTDNHLVGVQYFPSQMRPRKGEQGTQFSGSIVEGGYAFRNTSVWRVRLAFRVAV